MDVLGENEALQQFFEGQDVSGVLESEVVDMSMLEHYLSNDMDPGSFILPESPPDSASEPCSPPKVPDDSSWSTVQENTGAPCCHRDRGPHCPPRQPPQQRFMGLENSCINGSTPPTLPGLHSPCHPQHLSPAHRYIQAQPPPTPSVLQHSQNPECVAPANGYIQVHNPTPPVLRHPQNPECVAPANGYIQVHNPTPSVLQHSQNPECVAPANGYIQVHNPTPSVLQHSQNPECVAPANGFTQVHNPTPSVLQHSQNPECVAPANGFTQVHNPTPSVLQHPQNPECVAPANGYIQVHNPTPSVLQHPQNPECVAPANGYIQVHNPTPSVLQHPQNPERVAPANSYIQANTPPTPPINDPPQPPHCMNSANDYIKASPPTAPPGLQRLLPGYLEPRYTCLPLSPALQTGPVLPDTKKRRRSESLEGAAAPSYDSDGQNGSAGQGPHQLLAWEGYQPSQWSPLYNSSYQRLLSPGYHVDTDKGFNYSPTDEAFVCQKKNHFQVTVHIGMAGSPKYVKTPSGPKPIESFYVKVFGFKFEAQTHLITIEQSQSDRTKKLFLPVKVDLPGDKITKVTLGRLHFSETTANNMRKKGKPNPDQRFFMMVVALYASVKEGSFLLVAHVSERIIVRALNPGLFESDSEALWQRGQAVDTVVCQGRVGINTDAPDEALVVCGNAKIMGTVMHPSDRRAKQNIQEVDSTEQLKRIAQMRIVEYDYRPEFAMKMGIDQVHETGIIAQEVKELLPSAVKEVGDVTCADGEKIQNFLMVDKEQIFMENVGAVKQLSKLTDNLQTRIQELEVWTTRLSKLRNKGSLSAGSSADMQRKVSRNDRVPPPQEPAPRRSTTKYSHCLQRKVLQASIAMLVATMGICVISITGLYFLALNEDLGISHENSSNLFPNKTTTVRPTETSASVAPTLFPGPWPPDVDFCNLLYCEEVYCCPSVPGNQSIPMTTHAPTPPTNDSHAADGREQFLQKLKSAKDWTNTTVQSILIKENQHSIDQRYCVQGNCGSGNYSYAIPISKLVPVNMRVTVQMNTTELLVVLRCRADEYSVCSALKDYTIDDSLTMSNTQGSVHEWPLPVAQLYQSSYHFRTTVAGKANCNTNPNYAGVLFTDYHFHFYRRCD